jgi:hypothetical protein
MNLTKNVPGDRESPPVQFFSGHPHAEVPDIPRPVARTNTWQH